MKSSLGRNLVVVRFDFEPAARKKWSAEFPQNLMVARGDLRLTPLDEDGEGTWMTAGDFVFFGAPAGCELLAGDMGVSCVIVGADPLD